MTSIAIDLSCAGKGRKCRSTASLRKHCKETRRGKRKSYCRTRHNRKHRMSLRHRGGRRRRRNSHRRRRRGGFVAELRRALVPYALYRAQKHMQHKRKHRRTTEGWAPQPPPQQPPAQFPPPSPPQQRNNNRH